MNGTMVRKAVNIALAVAAIALVVLGVVGSFSPRFYGLPVTDNDWAILHFFDSRVRLFWIHGESEPIHVAQVRQGFRPVFRITPTRPAGPPLRNSTMGPSEPDADEYWEPEIIIGTRWQITSFGGGWQNALRVTTLPRRTRALPTVFSSYVRLPVSLVAVVMLIAPATAAIRGPILHRYRQRRDAYRRKRGLCVKCAYDLRGLPEPRCPECGTPV